MATNVDAQICVRRDASGNWDTSNPTLLNGEVGYITDLKLFKVGDGTSEWLDLPYVLPTAHGGTHYMGGTDEVYITSSQIDTGIGYNTYLQRIDIPIPLTRSGFPNGQWCGIPGTPMGYQFGAHWETDFFEPVGYTWQGYNTGTTSYQMMRPTSWAGALQMNAFSVGAYITAGLYRSSFDNGTVLGYSSYSGDELSFTAKFEPSYSYPSSNTATIIAGLLTDPTQTESSFEQGAYFKILMSPSGANLYAVYHYISSATGLPVRVTSASLGSVTGDSVYRIEFARYYDAANDEYWPVIAFMRDNTNVAYINTYSLYGATGTGYMDFTSLTPQVSIKNTAGATTKILYVDYMSATRYFVRTP